MRIQLAMRQNSHSQSGFSLIELMIAIAVMGVVTSQIFIVMGNQKKVYSSNERAVDTQETARMTLDLVSFDTRVGGYMIPAWTAVSSVDGGTADPDRYCASSVFADPGQIGDVPPNPMEQQDPALQGRRRRRDHCRQRDRGLAGPEPPHRWNAGNGRLHGRRGHHRGVAARDLLRAHQQRRSVSRTPSPSRPATR